MVRIGPLHVLQRTTWKYALVGGGVSIPLTVGLYWLSGMGSELSLDMVFVGGAVAGYLATARDAAMDTTAVGVRAGLVGGVPGLWLLAQFLGDATALTGPLWFRVVGVGLFGTIVVSLLFALAALAGLVGAKVGEWLVTRKADRRASTADGR